MMPPAAGAWWLVGKSNPSGGDDGAIDDAMQSQAGPVVRAAAAILVQGPIAERGGAAGVEAE